MRVSGEDELKSGDHVSWIGSAGVVTGRVLRHLTAPERVGAAGRLGTRVRASEQYPYVLVESDLGGQAAHRPEQLNRV
jgi:Hypervirulence associated proteins TUDOR domain